MTYTYTKFVIKIDMPAPFIIFYCKEVVGMFVIPSLQITAPGE